MSLFATDYTWTGVGDDNGWRTPANWGQTTKYPQGGDRAIFPAGCTAEVKIGAVENYDAVAQLRVLAGANVRFYAADPSAETRLDLKNSWEFNYENIAVTFDHVRVDGYKKLELGTGATLSAINGSDLRLGDFVAKNAAGVSLLSGSVLSCKYLDGRSSVNTVYTLDNATLTDSGTFDFQNTGSLTLSNGARMSVNVFQVTGDTVLTLDDSTFVVNDNFFCGMATPGGGRIVFKGAHPLFSMANGGAEFKTQNNSASYTGHFDFDFIVPEGGFAEAPVHHIGQQSFRSTGNNPTDYIRFNVLPSSPALSAGTQTVCPLFLSIQNGIVRSKLSNGDTATATFRFTDLSGATEATDDWGAKALYATIGSGAAAPAPSAAGSLSPLRTTSVNRRRITATGAVGAIATNGDTTHIELWAGEANNAATMAHVASLAPESAPANFSAEFTAPENIGEKKYYFQWRLFDIGEGGVTNRTESTPIFDATTKDTTIYTWTGAGDDNKWSNPANWTDDQGGDCIGYPQSADAKARFRKSATVDIDLYKTIASLDLAVADCDIVFTSSDTGAYRLTLNDLKMPLEGTTWTIDHAYVYRTADLTPAADSKVVVKNGGTFYMNSLQLYNSGSVFEIGDGGTNNINYLRIGSGSLVISNGYVNARQAIYVGSSTKGGSLLFKGTHPRLHSSLKDAYFTTDLASPEAILGFEVPEGGYESAVITCNSDKTRTFFSDSKSQGVTIKILETSGAFSGASATVSPLVNWPKGFTTANMVYAPIPSAGSAFAVENTTQLNVTINPYEREEGRLTVVSAHGAPSPAAGEHEGYAAGVEYPLSSGGIVVSGGVRHVPAGYNIFTVDGLTGERTPAGSGTEDSIEYEFPGGWVEIEWLWETENATTAGASEHGTVQIADGWAGEYGYATATAVPDEGWRFSFWSGDVTDVAILENPAKVPGNRPRTLVANFVPEDTEIVENRYTGANNGSWNTDSNWSLGHVPTAEENVVIPDGKGTIKITNAGKCASLWIAANNSPGIQLLGSGTPQDDQIRLDVRGNAITMASVTLGESANHNYNVLFNVGGDLCVSNTSKNATFTIYAGDAYGTNSNAAIIGGYTGSERQGEYWRGGAQVNVGGTLFLGGSHKSNTSTLQLHSHYKTGLSPVFRVGSLEIGARGAVDGYQNGWRSYNGIGLFGLGSARKNGGGASYGGTGGSASEFDVHAPGLIHGFNYAPIWPGSAGGIGGSDGGHGGSLFRVHASGAVRIDGTVNVNGRHWGTNTTRGGGSGGGVWITCDTFEAGDGASISAKGGNHSESGGATGGGGRIAVAAGCTADADIASFFQTGECSGYIGTEFASTLWPTLANVSGGVNTAFGAHYDWNDGAPGTALYLQNANGKSVLTVAGSPVAFGEAAPEYVTHIVDTGDVVCENSAYGYVPGTSGSSRYIADGYVWTNAVTHGAGTGTSVTVPAQGDTTLVWLWRDLEHNLVATSGGYGTVSAHGDWIADGETVTLAATPDAGATFVRWIGDIDAADAANAEITFAMTSPRRLVAVFDKPSAAPRSLTYSGGDWFDPATWDGTAIPGTNDAVSVTSALSFPFGSTIDVGSLHLSGAPALIAPVQGARNAEAPFGYDAPLVLHVHGDMAIDGASTVDIGELDGVIRTDIVVDGNLTIAGTAVVHAYASVGEADDALRTWRHYKAGGASVSVGGDINVEGSAKVFSHCHGRSGVGVVWHADGDFTLGTSAQFNGSEFSSYDKNRGNTTRAYGYGWRWPNGINVISYGTGSHGGAGGNREADTVYGYAYAPFLPGSPGNGKKNERKGEGGGTVRIDAGGAVALNGKIYVTGGNNDGSGNNAGAGGGVWITCDTFAAGSSAIIDACGGCSTQHGSCGGGGGGRVCIITGSLSEEQIDSLYATGVAEDVLVVAEDMGDELVSPWPTLVDVRGGINEENAANTSYSNHGKPGTAVYLQNAAGKAVVTVTGNQDTTETVPAYGQSTVETGVQTFSAPAFIYRNDGRSRYPCVGYEWEDAAGNTGSGATTSFTLDVRRDLTVTWHWGTLEHFLDVRDGGLCTVSYAAQGDNAPGWYDEGTVVRVTCAPADADTTFDAWLGDVAIADKAKASIDITVDRPKVIVATLHRDAARARSLVWTGEAGDADWFNKVNWDGLAIPGRYDAVLVTNGAFQARYPAEIEVASLAVTNATGFLFCKTNTATFAQIDAYTTAIDDFDPRPSALSVAGDFSAGGLARIYCGGIEQAFRVDVSVGGNATLGGGTKSSNRSRLQIYAMDMGAWDNLDNYRVGGGSLTVGGTFALEGFAQFTPAGCRKSGAVVPVKAARVVIGQNAEINASCRGFGRSFSNPGTGWRKTLYGYATSGSNNFGGTYGGQGGYNDTESFGYIAAPFYPGSTGNTGASNTGEIFSGGGAVRIDAHEIVLDGKILANAHGGYMVGGGSGGGVWLTCREFSLGGNAMIEAWHSDGSSYGGTGGGGGGRIAIGVNFSERKLQRMYSSGSLRGMVVTPLSEIAEWEGHFNVSAGKGPGDGRDGTAGTAVLVVSPPPETVFTLR
ncbi:MAG: hypothetical protein IJG18_03005 [Kiritimatiellae bacterium]|nr:hypothetical protein [Kiritimatiellia bacterium]